MRAFEIAETLLSRAFQRVDLAAENLANATTPGFKAHRLATQPFSVPGPAPETRALDLTEGKLAKTDSPFDLAIEGNGFFAVKSVDGKTFFTRDGQFSRDGNGQLVNARGMALQGASGDLKIGVGDTTIVEDGTVLQQGEPVARIGLSAFDDASALTPVGGGLFEAADGAASDAQGSRIRQGMLEASNVSTAGEMLALMAAMRSAESGQHLVQAFDDLLGRAFAAFGQA